MLDVRLWFYFQLSVYELQMKKTATPNDTIQSQQIFLKKISHLIQNFSVREVGDSTSVTSSILTSAHLWVSQYKLMLCSQSFTQTHRTWILAQNLK